MEEQGSKTIAAFDSLFTTNRIQMLKILLPRLHPRQQGGFAIYIKLLELQYAFSFLRLHPDIQLFGDVRPSAGFPQEEGEDTISLLDDLIPFSGPMEQARIQNMKSMIANFKKMKEMMSMIQMMQELFPEGTGGDGNPFDFLSGMAGMPDMSAMADMAALFRTGGEGPADPPHGQETAGGQETNAT